MTDLVRYEVLMQLEAPPRMDWRARKAEPKEIFSWMIDAAVAHGFHVVGTVSVRPMGGGA